MVKKASYKKEQRAFIYSLIMLIGGVGVYCLPNMGSLDVGLLQLLISSFLFQLASIAIGLGIKLLRRLFKRTEEQLFSKAFLLDTVEEGFAVWCWLVVAILFRYFQWLYLTG